MGKVKYVNERGLNTLITLIKRSQTGIYTARGQAIFADPTFLALSADEKEGIAVGASSIESAGLYQKVNGTWTLIDSFEEGYVYDIINNFVTTNDFVEGAGQRVQAGVNIVVVNTGTVASPVLKYDTLSGLLYLNEYQKKELASPLTMFLGIRGCLSSSELPSTEPAESATIEDGAFACIVSSDASEDGDIYQATVTVSESDTTQHDIVWNKIGNITTVEGAISLFSNVCPNTPLTDAEIEAMWNNA